MERKLWHEQQTRKGALTSIGLLIEGLSPPLWWAVSGARRVYQLLTLAWAPPRTAPPPRLGLHLGTVAPSLEVVHYRIARWCSGSRQQKAVQIRTTRCLRVSPPYALDACGIRYWGNTG